MRKTYKYFIPAALAIMALAGCVNEGDEPEVTGRKESPEFTATICGTQTRAFDRSWEEGDEIGISGCTRTNACYLTSNGADRFTAKSISDQIYFHDLNEATFTAYYPWTDLSEGSVKIEADTRMQDTRKRFDFLWATASGKMDTPEVELTFAHRMTKVSLTVKPGNEMSYEELKTATLSLKGFAHEGSFNTTDGTTATAEKDNEVWIFSDFAQFNDTEKTMAFSFIFFPQKFDKPLDFLAELNGSGSASEFSLEALIDFTGANREMDGTAARNEWVAGRQYNLSVTLHKCEITMDKCIINPWILIEGDDISVD